MKKYEVDVMVKVKVEAENEMAVKQLLSQNKFYMSMNYKGRSIKTIDKQSVNKINEIK